MGDRNNLIKFGPEWMRNFSREGSAGNSSSSQSAGGEPAGPAPGGSGGPGGARGSASAAASSSAASQAAASRMPKVQLAKLRYGREEMLALYDNNDTSPADLRHFDLLYNPRGNPPVALNNSFEDEVRDNIRSGPPMPTMERYAGRGAVPRSTAPPAESRGRGRSMTYVRPSLTGRSILPKTATLVRDRSGDEPPYDSQPGPSTRSWGNNGNNIQNRNGGGPDKNADWSTSNTAFKRWQGSSSWRRQPGRENGEEWRQPESTRSRPAERSDWGERSERGRERQTSWNSSRRPWSNDSHNEDNLPEWATDGTEACGGTFDSSGAFHGFSNDDSALPSKTDAFAHTANPLARSQTAGNFTDANRKPNPGEQGSKEWWSTEKAKKLSPKLILSANDVKYKKHSRFEMISKIVDPKASTSGAAAAPSPTFEEPKPQTNIREAETDKTNHDHSKRQKLSFNHDFEGKTFDSLMRSDINAEEANDEASNFRSVMITPNNSLRTRHQHMVPTAAGQPKPQSAAHQNHIQEREPLRTANNPITHQKEDEFSNLIDMSLENLHISDIPLLPITAPTVSNVGMMGISSAASTMPANIGMQHGMSSSAFRNAGPAGNPSHSVQSGVSMSNSGMTHVNQSMGIHVRPSANTRMTMPLSSIPTPVISTARMSSAPISIPGVRGPAPLPYSAGRGVSALFMRQNANNAHQQQMGGDIQSARFPLHELQQTGYSSMYSEVMATRPPVPQSVPLVDQWYYQDPAKNIQGPFSSLEMYNWYSAGFFTADLMVRRACDTHMRPLGTYGPLVPFGDMLAYPMAGAYESQPRDLMPNTQQTLALGNMLKMDSTSELSMDSEEFMSVAKKMIKKAMPHIVDPLWSQSEPTMDMWNPEPTPRADPRSEDISSFFWDQQPNAMQTKSIIPEEIVKGMQTEDQILAQLRAAQGAQSAEQAAAATPPPQAPFLSQEAPPAAATAPPPVPTTTPAVTPDLGELQKLIQKDTLISTKEEKVKTENKVEPSSEEAVSKPAPQQTKENKKAAKSEPEKSTKKESNGKKKKNKEDKKEDSDAKKEEDSVKAPKSEESTTKSKKEDKINKKELEKEKKEWLKDGFTIVKGPEKVGKESKKRSDEAKQAEEAERKRKEDEKAAAEEEKKKSQGEVTRRQQLSTAEPAVREAAPRRAPWSGVGAAAPDLPLADIQRLEREKKLEQIKEQQQMMQLIAQQQQTQLVREQEMQAGLGWNKKQGVTMNITESLAEIQAEARKQAAAAAATAAAAAASAAEQAPVILQPTNIVPWAKSTNGGFWETERTAQVDKAEQPRPAEAAKPRRKQASSAPAAPVAPAQPPPPKKKLSPAHEFEGWCTSALVAWTTKIDVPTFIGFLKDIESPFEVKDYVKCYLGDTKEASDFARQFLERRSKLWRASAVTHSDDLSHPAAAVIPRAGAGAGASSEYYLDTKNKGKKTKKNKMQKVDARLLGFSTTAAEDRINVGDIDTA